MMGIHSLPFLVGKPERLPIGIDSNAAVEDAQREGELAEHEAVLAFVSERFPH